MNTLRRVIRQKAEEIRFSGVLFLCRNDLKIQEAFGHRDRANEIENEISTRFGVASATKGFTALGIARLIDDGKVGLDTLVASIVGSKLRSLHPDIKISHLLGHTSGIGDYFDEEVAQSVNDVVLKIPAQNLLSPIDYFPMIESVDQKFRPGERFSYSNSGYIVLAAIIEIVSGQSFQKFIEREIFARSGMCRSGFFRSDCLPADTALGYIPHGNSWRSNVFILPVWGGGDGGAYSTLEDIQTFWKALKEFRIVSQEFLEVFLHPRQFSEKEKLHYGYGFWIDSKTDRIILEGYDAGVSFYSVTELEGEDGYTIISNTSSGAWPMVNFLAQYGLNETGCKK